jgi:hypothetical protein
LNLKLFIIYFNYFNYFCKSLLQKIKTRESYSLQFCQLICMEISVHIPTMSFNFKNTDSTFAEQQLIINAHKDINIRVTLESFKHFSNRVNRVRTISINFYIIREGNWVNRFYDIQNCSTFRSVICRLFVETERLMNKILLTKMNLIIKLHSTATFTIMWVLWAVCIHT